MIGSPVVNTCHIIVICIYRVGLHSKSRTTYIWISLNVEILRARIDKQDRSWSEYAVDRKGQEVE